ncbi:class V chitinase chi100 [Colletotrichum asianum]
MTTGTNLSLLAKLGCKGDGVPRENYVESLIYKDEDGKEWVAGTCECNFEIAEEIFDVVVEALEGLKEAFCAVMLESCNIILQSGVMAIPGGPFLRTAVQGAKTFVENACGIPSWDFDLFAVFNPLANAPDSLGESKGCLRKNKSKCKRVDPKPDPKPTNKPAVTDEPNSSARDSPTTTASATTSACKIARRAKDGAAKDDVPKIFGEAETSTEGCGKDETIHITSTSQDMGHYESEVPMTCSKKWSQACFHYRSVMSVHTNTPDMVRWTCGATAGTSSNGKATNDWGLMAISKPKKTHQHWFPWVNGFVARTTLIKDGKENVKGCERDEWPPRYFWPGDKEAKKKRLVQKIRLIEWHENGGAGSMFNGFCNNNAAASSNAGKGTYEQQKFLKTVGDAKIETPDPNKKPLTMSQSTLRAIFTIKDWDNLSEEKDDAPKWHGLKENKCWPSLLAPEDPGFALLTDDEFYKQGQHPELAHHTASYRGLPDLQLLKKALKDSNPSPPFPYSNVDVAVYDDRKFNAKLIPDEYREILPGLPALPKPAVVPRAIRRNLTELTEDDSKELEWADLDVDVDGYNDEELDEWFERYAELLKKRNMRGSGRVSPQVAAAQPTPVVSTRGMATLAVEASRLTSEFPRATHHDG